MAGRAVNQNEVVGSNDFAGFAGYTQLNHCMNEFTRCGYVAHFFVCTKNFTAINSIMHVDGIFKTPSTCSGKILHCK